jgi:hypothetical protein
VTIGCTAPNAAYHRDDDATIEGDAGGRADARPSDAPPLVDTAVVADAATLPETGNPPPDAGVTPPDLAPPLDVATLADTAPPAPDVAVLPPDAAPDLPPDGPLPVGTGLRGDYYDGSELEKGDTGTLDLRRVDGTVNFEWGTGRPASQVDDDWFSVRWLGQVMPLHAENYTFSVLTDDGVRLWVNNVLIIDRWTNPSTAMQSGSIMLQAYQKYDIRMEYFETTGTARAKLYWSSYSQPMEIIPRARLFPAP